MLIKNQIDFENSHLFDFENSHLSIDFSTGFPGIVPSVPEGLSSGVFPVVFLFQEII